MIITWEGADNFTLSGKNTTVNLGENISLGSVKINEPGEYEVGGIQIEVIDGIVQTFIEGMVVGHIKKTKVLSDESMEKLSDIDILLIGVGGGDFFDTKTALQVIAQIEPSIVIPMHGGDLSDFAKEEGVPAEGKDEIKISKAELSEEGRQVVILNARR